MIFVGVDWAEAHHDVHVADEEGHRLSKARLPEGVEGIARFHELVGAHVEDAHEVVIGIETDRGLFVSALVAAGYQVYAVNPMSTSRYRDRHSTSGAKSDAGDAEVLSDMVRTDRHHHRLVAADTAEVEAIKVLARAHQSMVWSKGRQANGLRSTLREFYPAALLAFDDLTSGDALEVLRIAPTPVLGASLSRSKIAAALRRGGRQRRVEERAVEIQAALRSEQLAAPPAVEAAMGSFGRGQRGGARRDGHPDRPPGRGARLEILRHTQTPKWSVPCQDSGPSSAPGCSASSATSRTATPTPSLAKTMPARHPSPGRLAPRRRSSPATCATDAWPTPSTCGPSPPSAPLPAPGRTTTPGGQQVTDTIRPYGPSATASSASSTAASPTMSPTTNRSPGAIVRRPS